MKRKMYKKGFLLCLCMAFALTLLSACKKDDNTATTMRLEKKQGTVGVEDDKDKEVEPREGMQLYSGYEVGTAESSLAWIGLDDSKAIKLDEISTAEVAQSGKKLTVNLHEGKVFFNVSEPLEEEETFDIETSTMITGIRGTSGWVEIIDEYTSRLVVLEGEVEVQSYDPDTGNLRTTIVTGGQILTVVYHGDIHDVGSEDVWIEGLISDNIIISGNIVYSESGLRLEELQEMNIPYFVSEEIIQSEKIQQKIQETTTLSLPEIIQMHENSEPFGGNSTAETEESTEVVDEIPEGADTTTPENAGAQTTPPASAINNPATPSGEHVTTTETEVYYNPVTREWYTTEVETVTSTSTVESNEETKVTGTTNGSVSNGETNSNSGNGSSNAVSSGGQLVPEDTVTYKPSIQLATDTSGNPQYATVTHYVETITYKVDTNGNVTSNTTTENKGAETVPVQQDSNGNYSITFTNYDPATSMNEPTITLSL